MHRDGWSCRSCRDNSSTLHVHHLRYIEDKEPWEYDDEWLVTLCEGCHHDAHIKNNITTTRDSFDIKYFIDKYAFLSSRRLFHTVEFHKGVIYLHLRDDVKFKLDGVIGMMYFLARLKDFAEKNGEYIIILKYDNQEVNVSDLIAKIPFDTNAKEYTLMVNKHTIQYGEAKESNG
jgi:hypothetical protein